MTSGAMGRNWYCGDERSSYRGGGRDGLAGWGVRHFG